MADKTTIINRSLGLLGAEPIVNITDDMPEAKIASRFYPESRKSVLSEVLWNFAYKIETLNAIVETPAVIVDNLSFYFQLPSDCIRVWTVAPKWASWKRQGDRILSSVNEAGIIYVFDQEDTTQYSASFTDAFADKLASDMCYAITNSQSDSAKLLEKYNSVSLPKATAENSQEGTPAEVEDSLWVNARFGFSPVGGRGNVIA